MQTHSSQREGAANNNTSDVIKGTADITGLAPSSQAAAAATLAAPEAKAAQDTLSLRYVHFLCVTRLYFCLCTTVLVFSSMLLSVVNLK